MVDYKHQKPLEFDDDLQRDPDKIPDLVDDDSDSKNEENGPF